MAAWPATSGRVIISIPLLERLPADNPPTFFAGCGFLNSCLDVCPKLLMNP